MDINLGCSGWVYGLRVVAGLLTNINMKRALLLAEGFYQLGKSNGIYDASKSALHAYMRAATVEIKKHLL